MQALGFQWMEGSSHPSVENVAIVLPLIAKRENRNVQLPDIGGDPSVIYVKPGYQADLDSLVQDTIRLTTAVKDTCSETCENSEPTVQYIGAKNTASMAKRWGRLLELRNTQLYGMH